MSKVESAPAEDPDDLLPLLDEELNRLPQRFRAALVACELEGKSRREAAAAARAVRGNALHPPGAGPEAAARAIAPARRQPGRRACRGLPRPVVLAMIPERLMDSTVQAALGFASRSGAAGDSPAAVASLAERVLKIMLADQAVPVLCPVMAAGAAAAIVLGLIALWPPDLRLRSRPSRARMTCPGGSSTRPALAWRTHRSGPSSGSWGEREDGRHGKNRRPGPLRPAAEPGITKPRRPRSRRVNSACSPAPRRPARLAGDGRSRRAAGTENTFEITVERRRRSPRPRDRPERPADRRAPISRRS